MLDAFLGGLVEGRQKCWSCNLVFLDLTNSEKASLCRKRSHCLIAVFVWNWNDRKRRNHERGSCLVLDMSVDFFL